MAHSSLFYSGDDIHHSYTTTSHYSLIFLATIKYSAYHHVSGRWRSLIHHTKQTGTQAQIAFQSGRQMTSLYRIYQTFAELTQPLLEQIGPFLEENAEATLDDFWNSVCRFKHGRLPPWAPTAADSWVERSLGRALQRQVCISFDVRDMLVEN